MSTSITKRKSNYVQYVMTGRLSEKGQLVLPKGFRDEQNLATGSPIAILRMGNALLLLPEAERFEKICVSIEQTLQASDIGGTEIIDSLPETRREVFRKLYPSLAKTEKI